MNLPESSRFQLAEGLNICRLPVGMWQVSGRHGQIEPSTAVQAMLDLFDAGYSTFDLADHYGPAEDFVGEFRRRLSSERSEAALDELQAFTKWVPRPGPMTGEIVEQAINVSRQRMQTPTLDLLQFHWWDYADSRYLDALQHLADLQAAGKIRYLALTNFDTEHLETIVDAGIKVVSNQVQFSLVDMRPTARMADLCRQHNIGLLTYGTLCGGLLSEHWLNRPEPSGADLSTVSMQKYKRMIDSWGGWVLFQRLLGELNSIAEKHDVSVANVAVRYILDQPLVAGVIVGCRLGLSEHIADNARVFHVDLDDSSRDLLQTVIEDSRDLMDVIGDCGNEYRR